MKIRVDGKPIFDETGKIIQIVVEKQDTVQITTPAADCRACVYVMSYDSCSISIEGGSSIIDSISGVGMEISLFQCAFEIRKNSGLFVLNGDTLAKEGIYNLSIPLVPRIIRQLLDNSEINYQYEKYKDTEIFRVHKSNQNLFEKMVTECIEFRCSDSVNHGNCDILRQLPIRVAIEESDKLMHLCKKHAIYPSDRGGYNIKVEGYSNSKLNQYYYNETRMWD